MTARITIFDTTLRDGEQSPGCTMNQREKLRLADQLDRLGVDVIEAGFPIASDGDFESVKAIAIAVRRPIIAALPRACQPDIERAWIALKHAAQPRIHIVLATSDIHLKYKLRITRDQCVEQARESVRFAKSLCDDVEFSSEDADSARTQYFLCHVLDAVVEVGATTLNIADTVGYTVPAEFGDLITTIRQRVKGIENVTVSAHCHNDLGMAVANAMAAVAAGARQVECTINGIGERAGNASLEEIVMAMRVRPTGTPTKPESLASKFSPTSQMLSEITGDAGATEQGDYRSECICPRSRHSSGRRSKESPDLRNHDAAVGRSARFEAGAGQALGPTRSQYPLRTIGLPVGSQRTR